LNLSSIILNLADYGYFPAIQRRLMSEIYTILPDILRSLPSFLVEYYYLDIVLVIGSGLFIYGTLWIFRKADRVIKYSFNVLSESMAFILILGFLILGIRGGMQSRPIRQAHAFFSSNRAVGYLVLNSTFTVLRSSSQASLAEHHLLNKEESVKLIETMLRQDNEQMIDANYPFLRRKQWADAPRKLNIVIFIMESWTGDYIASIGGRNSDTPFFDSIAAKGMLFTNFLANGQRSNVATPAVLSSIPGFYSRSIAPTQRTMIGSQSELNNFLGLGSILAKQGYITSFHHGAKIGSMGFDAYSRLSGFTHYYGKEDYPNLNSDVQDGTWGIWDEELFLDTVRRIDGFREPFCSVVYSLTSHNPFNIPSRREDLFKEYSGENKYQIALRYSDYSLQQFFKAAADKPWFKNTIFIITGDHTNYALGKDLRSLFHVPLLVYAPGIIESKKCGQIGSHLDILPTVLDLLHVSAVHASAGRSLTDSSQTHYAVVTDGTQYAIFTDTLVLINDLEKNIGLYDYHKDPLFKNNLESKYPEMAQELKKYLYAYVQEISSAIANNKICRDIDLK
jgi:phosphoglycerol transferase MdoB-like AlkP superfamily enzyme